jgi:hypothetical protein
MGLSIIINSSSSYEYISAIALVLNIDLVLNPVNNST